MNHFTGFKENIGDENDKRTRRQIANRARDDAARTKELAALHSWKANQPPAPPVPRKHEGVSAEDEGDVTAAYRWYRTLGSPTKETMLAVIAETKGVKLTSDQIDALPWTQHDRALDHAQLQKLLNEEDQATAAIATEANPKQLSKTNDIDPRVLAAVLKAYREYKGLGIPKLITFTTILGETTGLESSYEDVSELPWEEDKLTVNEDRMAELQQQYEEQMSAEKRNEALRQKRIVEREKRRAAIRQKAQEEEAKRKELAAQAEKIAAEKGQDLPLFMQQRISLREHERMNATDKKAWEESRALKAFAWYSRLTGSNRKRLKKIVSTMKECDIVPDDVDLLPWSPSGGWVDHIKIDEMSRRCNDLAF